MDDTAAAPPKALCPSCGEWVSDYDGFGVLFHVKCGFCSHPSLLGDVCQTCGEEPDGG